jgi:hypothetical protein
MESFVGQVGVSNARSLVLCAALCFGVIWAVAVFDEVEMRIVDP